MLQWPMAKKNEPSVQITEGLGLPVQLCHMRFQVYAERGQE